MPAEEFLQGVEEFNQRQFYTCHDTLEALWMVSTEPEKRFYQGVLQIAVGCYHLSNNNWRGAVILIGEGIKRLSDYQPHYESINVSQLIEESYNLLRYLQETGEEKVEQISIELGLNPQTETPIPSSQLPCKLPMISFIS